MKKIIRSSVCVMLAAFLLLGLAACGEKEWTRSGYYSDENNHMLSVTYMDLDEESGWYVGISLGENFMDDSYAGMVEADGNTLKGVLASSGEEGGSITVTVTEEGESGVMVAVDGGETYHFQPMDIPKATIFVTVNTEGCGNIEYVEGESIPEPDPEYPFQSAQINLAEPTTHTILAYPDEGWVFVKWTKNGEDFSTEPVITVLLDETADFIAVFDVDESEDGQNPAMNVIGEYQSGRAHALVEAEGDNGVKITIDWGGSADTVARWIIRGEINSSTMSVAYIDSTKSIITYNENGDVVSEEVEYEGGTGVIVFNEDGTFTWNDTQSEYGELVFEWLSVEE